jgi:UDP-GlcNAc:undecaprenyl-phosphate GlcNAc-1-phosphate transferase
VISLYLIAFASAFVTTLATAPLWRKWCLCVGLVDDPGARKIHEQSVPLAGGLAVMTGLVLPIAAAVLALVIHQINHPSPTPTIHSAAGMPPEGQSLDLLVHGLHKRAFELIAIFLGAFGMLAVGVLDDKHELRPATKFAGQFLVALLIAAAGVRVTLFVPSTLFSYAITILWMLTLINAFNFTDNMNGLCTGLGIIGAFYFALISALAVQYLVALIAALACGALVGFLPFNFPRARAFLGDAGSHLVGYLMGVLAILPHFHTPKQPRAWAVLSPLFILAIPLLDLAWVVLLRWRMGKPFYIGDTNHLSHRLVQLGLSRTKAVSVIWLLAAIVGAFSLL